MDAAIFKAGHCAAHTFGPVTRPKGFPLRSDTLDHNFFVVGIGHYQSQNIGSVGSIAPSALPRKN